MFKVINEELKKSHITLGVYEIVAIEKRQFQLAYIPEMRAGCYCECFWLSDCESKNYGVGCWLLFRFQL